MVKLFCENSLRAFVFSVDPLESEIEPEDGEHRFAVTSRHLLRRMTAADVKALGAGGRHFGCCAEAAVWAFERGVPGAWILVFRINRRLGG